ncbi:MAG TPA: ABC transporter permease, partial [Gemmataceae bacterium]|nr:ABC transporter permease [Gemmataceae bacterium]
SELWRAIYTGGFGSRRAGMNTLIKAAPLILTALCTALPARLGLVIIGNEGALVLGGLAAAFVGVPLSSLPFPLPQAGMLVCAMGAGAALIALAGGLSHWRGVNATISSLLLTYVVIGVFDYVVEGPLRDPASLNKPSTPPIGPNAFLGTVPGLDVHWGLVFGVIACLAAWVLLDHTTFGFAARMTGGNVRAAKAAGLGVGRLVLVTCLLGGAAAGLAGGVEIAAVHKQANGALYAARLGYTGILVSFVARHHPLGIIPVALLFGGLKAASDTLQIRLGLPDASVDVLVGIVFVLILLFETFYGRLRVFQQRDLKPAAGPAVAPSRAA